MPAISVGLIGPGLVGKEFLHQLLQFKHPKVSIDIVGVISTSRMKLGTPLHNVQLDADAQPANLDHFFQHVKSMPNAVIVDCTSSLDIPQKYSQILQWGHVITPNKKGFSSSLDLYRSIVQTAQQNSKFLLHESTVGAGLPILSTLSDLTTTGDEIIKMEGIFSGTLSYIFNLFSTAQSQQSVTFSQIVKEAQQLGYTEPDPRDDLNGLDVARKVVILGRVCGLSLDLSTLEIENIVPAELRELELNSFMNKLSDSDSYFTKMKEEAAKEGKVLRYVGCVDLKNPKLSSVKLQRYDKDHVFAGMKGSDNIVKITTKRFPNSIVVQGAGAGAAVTAFGMFSDLLQIVKSVGGPL
jgi:homoserine dehydrogenase